MTEINEFSGRNSQKDVKFSIIIPAHNEENTLENVWIQLQKHQRHIKSKRKL